MARRKRSFLDELLSGRWENRRKATTSRRRAQWTLATRAQKKAQTRKRAGASRTTAAGRSWPKRACVTCSAGSRQPCKTKSGRPASMPHAARA